MPEITLQELQTIQTVEKDHRKLIGVLGNLYNYLKFVQNHPSYSDNPEAQKVADRALEIMEANVQDEA